ncbi:hypothetical protein, partial [Nostoc sp.]|uniref:hypothetical protein n=1 Tax=Nostoc sp. TaxID=1180 RepID=UPI002FF9CD3F
FMNQAVSSLPVNLLYTALQFLINFYYFSKPDASYQVCLFKSKQRGRNTPKLSLYVTSHIWLYASLESVSDFISTIAEWE